MRSEVGKGYPLASTLCIMSNHIYFVVVFFSNCDYPLTQKGYIYFISLTWGQSKCSNWYLANAAECRTILYQLPQHIICRISMTRVFFNYCIVCTSHFSYKTVSKRLGIMFDSCIFFNLESTWHRVARTRVKQTKASRAHNLGVIYSQGHEVSCAMNTKSVKQ